MFMTWWYVAVGVVGALLFGWMMMFIGDLLFGEDDSDDEEDFRMFRRDED